MRTRILALELKQLDVQTLFAQKNPESRTFANDRYLDPIFESLLAGNAILTCDVLKLFRTCCFAHASKHDKRSVLYDAMRRIDDHGESALRNHQMRFPEESEADASVAHIRRLVNRAEELLPEGNYAGTPDVDGDNGSS